ncbi:hypothetical protein [Castellaniella defragrans]|uniref:hypothetical protein n=1 Tax=Castellaniella defragrans TaxID=75697 RepID=UPI0018E0ABA1|nr:hypothetical protein [Castellaniella defragrans]
MSRSSTTLKRVMGMLSTHVGEIRLEGRQISGLPSCEVARRGLELVPGGRPIFPMPTAEENLLATAANRHQSARPCGLAQRHCIIGKGRVVRSGDSAALRRDGEVVEHYLGV